MITLKEVVIWKAPRPRMYLTPVFTKTELDYYTRCVDKGYEDAFQKVKIAAMTGGKLREAENTEIGLPYVYVVKEGDSLSYIRHDSIVSWMKNKHLSQLMSADGSFGFSAKKGAFGITEARACLVDSDKTSMYDVLLEPHFYVRGVKISPKAIVAMPVLMLSDPMFQKLGAY